MNTLRLILRMLRRDWRAGELTVLGLALMVAVASLTSVGFLTDRISQALIQESHQLLGGDLLLTSDHPLREAVRQEAVRRGLRHLVPAHVHAPAHRVHHHRVLAGLGQGRLSRFKCVTHRVSLPDHRKPASVLDFSAFTQGQLRFLG